MAAFGKADGNEILGNKRKLRGSVLSLDYCMTGDVIEFVEGFLEASSAEATKRPVLIEIGLTEIGKRGFSNTCIECHRTVVARPFLSVVSSEHTFH
ncbi:hypothetical protein K0M31_017932 [Melipona bicolor]|uniref:Uncharacterized protein n=1 Tax=Melipona bicolor TaxID=60889 RepID=A0AA40G604_9HYME|nr:hypothetical protein K0M31_017932 [Melipona bicolor]